MDAREQQEQRIDSPSVELGGDDPVVALAYAELMRQAAVLELPDQRRQRRLSATRIHRMRVATRRARSALRAFRNVLPDQFDDVLAAELKWLAAVLGEVRDLDVYRERYAVHLKALPKADAQALAPYGAFLQTEWERASTALGEALQGQRYENLMTTLFERVRNGPPSDLLNTHAEITIAGTGVAYLKAAKSRVLKRGSRVGGKAPPAKLHELRKEGKRFRYLLEFFQPFFAGRFGDARKAAIRLQDVLGEHQDAMAAIERLRAYAATVPLEETFRDELLALGQLIDVQRRNAKRARKRFDRTWREFEDATETV
jgi:CHAD domain-containing protein